MSGRDLYPQLEARQKFKIQLVLWIPQDQQSETVVYLAVYLQYRRHFSEQIRVM